MFIRAAPVHSCSTDRTKAQRNLAARSDIRLPLSIEALSDSTLREQLRAIAIRVRDLVAAGLAEARRNKGPDCLPPLLVAHASALQIFENESAGYFHNVPGGLELLHSFACKPGCTFCCHLHVDVTSLEAVAIAAGLAAGRRDAVAATAPRVQDLSVDARRAARIPCALLADGVCTSYETRPVACRALYSTDARACEQVLLAPLGATLPPIRSPAVPRALADTFAAGVNAALAAAGLQSGLFELTAALEALLRDPQATERWLGGERVFPARR